MARDLQRSVHHRCVRGGGAVLVPDQGVGSAKGMVPSVTDDPGAEGEVHETAQDHQILRGKLWRRQRGNGGGFTDRQPSSSAFGTPSRSRRNTFFSSAAAALGRRTGWSDTWLFSSDFAVR